MARTDYRTVDDYIAAQPEAARPVLQQVRAAIRQALPEAQEVISYQIAAYRVAGRVALYFAGWKSHYSIYPLSERLTQALGAELASYELEKGTIRFPLDRPVPTALIAAIARLKADEAMDRAKAKKR